MAIDSSSVTHPTRAKRVRVVIGAFVSLAGVLVLAVPNCKRSHLREKSVTIPVAGATLSGTLYTLPSTRESLPVVVILHGSGRDGRSNRYYRILAETFAEEGYASFIYDKRGSERSTGQLYSVPFQFLIDDAVTVVKNVRSMPESDDRRILVWGGSEGGSNAPEVAVRSGASALIVQSASGVPFWKQNRFQNLRALANMGLSQSELALEAEAHSAAMNFARTGTGWKEFERLKDKGIHLPINAGPQDAWWRWYGTKLDYEPGPWLKKLNVPILAIWGADDILVPIEESVATFRSALRTNPQKTLLVIRPADHSISANGQIVHLKTLGNWLSELP